MYTVDYFERVVAEDIPALPKTVRERIRRAIEERLTLDSIGYGKPLQYSLKGHRRLRVGDYRVVYRIVSAEKRILIVAIDHRKDIYEIR